MSFNWRTFWLLLPFTHQIERNQKMYEIKTAAQTVSLSQTTKISNLSKHFDWLTLEYKMQLSFYRYGFCREFALKYNAIFCLQYDTRSVCQLSRYFAAHWDSVVFSDITVCTYSHLFCAMKMVRNRLRKNALFREITCFIKLPSTRNCDKYRWENSWHHRTIAYKNTFISHNNI